jgi:hypothetical protein
MLYVNTLFKNLISPNRGYTCLINENVMPVIFVHDVNVQYFHTTDPHNMRTVQ